MIEDDWYSVDIPKKRYFHWESFPGFIGPRKRRWIFLEWLYLLVYNAWSYLTNRPTFRTLIRFRMSDWIYSVSCIPGLEFSEWYNSKTGERCTTRSYHDGPPGQEE